MKHLFIILTAVFATIPAIAQDVEKRGSSERVTFITDGVDSIPTNVSQVMSVPPQFYGGMGAMDKFIIDNLRYPAEAWNDTTYKKKGRVWLLLCHKERRQGCLSTSHKHAPCTV